MRFSPWLLVLVIACLPLQPAPIRADDAGDKVKAGTKLLEEGDRLADDGKPREAVIRYKSAYEQLLPRLRQIPFKHEVKRDVTKREQLKATLLKEFEEDMTPEEFRANEMAMKAFGLVPRTLDLKPLLVQVYSEEIAAFYDPKTKTMHLIEEPESKSKAQPTFFERLLGKKPGFDKDENKTVIAHELTHALSDQHYDLDALHKSSKHDDDRSLAVSALIEGEATLAMMGAQMEDWDGSKITKLPADDLDRGLSFISPFLTMMGAGKSLRQAPPIISESMLFPYLRGMVFCAKLTNQGGWKAVDEAYKNPPVSTEQILHPEKYKIKLDLPMIVDLGELKPGAGWKELGRNVLGELQTSIMLGKQGPKAAAGWDGDRYAVFEGREGKLGLVWLSTWDSEDDARELVRAYTPYQTKRMGKDAFQPERIPDSLWRCQDDVCRVVERRGADVVVVEGFPPAATGALLEAAFRAKKTEFSPNHPSPLDRKPAEK
jgi:hypothetical protein